MYHVEGVRAALRNYTSETCNPEVYSYLRFGVLLYPFCANLIVLGYMEAYERLPPECLIRILAFLALHDIMALVTTSKRWKALIYENENSVYARLAFNHGFISSPLISFETARQGWISLAFEGVSTWKQFCRVQLGATRRWKGKESAFVTSDLFGNEQEVLPHRFKIDVDKQLLAMTSGARPPALVVHCLRNTSRNSLFSLNRIKPLSHLEMSNGFLVFTCADPVALEVWRWAEDQHTDPVDCSPEPQQVFTYQSAMAAHEHVPAGTTIRGELIPVGVLRNPGSLQVLRLVYPSLCVGSRDGTHLWLWDIRTRELIQTIDMPSSNALMFGMRYVDINKTHVFVATDIVSVYSRRTGQYVFRLSPEQLNRFCSSVHSPTPTRDHDNCFHQLALHPYSPILEEKNRVPPDDRVIAIHVSPNGQDFVAITFCGYVLYVTQFDPTLQERSSTTSERQSETATTQPHISVTRVYNGFLTYLAYDGEHIVVTGAQGVCMINLRPHLHHEVPKGTNPELYPFPAQIASLIPPFGGGKTSYEGASCLQLTREGFWIAWPPNLSIGLEVPFQRARKGIGMIDFMRPRMSNLGPNAGSKARRLSWG